MNTIQVSENIIERLSDLLARVTLDLRQEDNEDLRKAIWIVTCYKKLIHLKAERKKMYAEAKLSGTKVPAEKEKLLKELIEQFNEEIKQEEEKQ